MEDSFDGTCLSQRGFLLDGCWCCVTSGTGASERAGSTSLLRPPRHRDWQLGGGEQGAEHSVPAPSPRRPLHLGSQDPCRRSGSGWARARTAQSGGHVTRRAVTDGSRPPTRTRRAGPGPELPEPGTPAQRARPGPGWPGARSEEARAASRGHVLPPRHGALAERSGDGPARRAGPRWSRSAQGPALAGVSAESGSDWVGQGW
jgi:hypothetical protein